MKYLTIPITDLTPSSICLGTANLGSAIPQNAAFDLLDAYVEQGGNFLDTAKIYADWLPGEKSISEKTIGTWLQQRKHRDRIIIATKGAHPDFATMHIPRLSRADIFADVEASLRNLQIEQIDLYWLHRDDVNRPVAEILDSLLELTRSGKIRYFGCSNWQAERIRAAQTYVQYSGKPGFIANQMMWSLAVVPQDALADQTTVAMNAELREYHSETSLTAIPYSSQANGWFQRMANGTMHQMNAAQQKMYNRPENERRFRRAQQLAAETGYSITEIVLAYLQSQPFLTIPIVGCQRLEQLCESLQAGDVRLSPEQLQFLEY